MHHKSVKLNPVLLKSSRMKENENSISFAPIILSEPVNNAGENDKQSIKQPSTHSEYVHFYIQLNAHSRFSK